MSVEESSIYTDCILPETYRKALWSPAGLSPTGGYAALGWRIIIFRETNTVTSCLLTVITTKHRVQFYSEPTSVQNNAEWPLVRIFKSSNTMHLVAHMGEVSLLISLIISWTSILVEKPNSRHLKNLIASEYFVSLIANLCERISCHLTFFLAGAWSQKIVPHMSAEAAAVLALGNQHGEINLWRSVLENFFLFFRLPSRRNYDNKREYFNRYSPRSGIAPLSKIQSHATTVACLEWSKWHILDGKRKA